MNPISAVLLLFATTALAGVPEDELLSSSRVTVHKSEFDRIERILKEADFEKAAYDEIWVFRVFRVIYDAVDSFDGYKSKSPR